MNIREFTVSICVSLVLLSCGGNEEQQKGASIKKEISEDIFSLKSGVRPDSVQLKKALGRVEREYKGSISKYAYITPQSRTVIWAMNKGDYIPEFGLLKDKGSEWETVMLALPDEAIAAYSYPQFEVVHLATVPNAKETVAWAAIHVSGIGGVNEDGQRDEIDEDVVVAFKMNEKGNMVYDAKSAKKYDAVYRQILRKEKLRWALAYEIGKVYNEYPELNQFITSVLEYRYEGGFIEAYINNGKTYCCGCPPYAIRFIYGKESKIWNVYYDLIQDSRDLYISSLQRSHKHWTFNAELRFMDTITYQAKLDTLWLETPVTRLTLKAEGKGEMVFIYDQHTRYLPQSPVECNLDEGY